MELPVDGKCGSDWRSLDRIDWEWGHLVVEEEQHPMMKEETGLVVEEHALEEGEQWPE